MAGSVNAEGVFSIFKTTSYTKNHVLRYNVGTSFINKAWHTSNSATIANSNILFGGGTDVDFESVFY
jgi:hypothetical protein